MIYINLFSSVMNFRMNLRYLNNPVFTYTAFSNVNKFISKDSNFYLYSLVLVMLWTSVG